MTSKHLGQSLFILACWTASFDQFLNIQAGFNVRFCQLCTFIILGLIVANKALGRGNLGKTIAVPGLTPLAMWVLIVSVLGFAASLPLRGIGYTFWTILCAVSVLLPGEFFKTPQERQRLLELYLRGFTVVAIIGIAQFGMALIGIQPPFVDQWWIPGLIPRVNGFSYEPSYYSTYLLLGYIPARIAASDGQLRLSIRRRYRRQSLIIMIAIIASSSRMGVLFLALWELAKGFKFALDSFYSKSPAKISVIILTLAAVTSLSVAVVRKYSEQLDEASFLLNGLGIVEGHASHSVDDRASAFLSTMKVFEKSPVVGVGLGSVAEYIAISDGVYPKSYEDLKEHEGGSVFAEILAGTGIVGLSCFLCFVSSLLFAGYRSGRKQEGRARGSLMMGLIASALVVLFMLQLNQNILRPYLWLHFAVIACLAAPRGKVHLMAPSATGARIDG